MATPEHSGNGNSDADDSGNDDAAGDIAPIDFNIFVLSLNASALMQLGEAPEAQTPPQINLGMARHTIDLLGMLEEKTRGNLSGEEERLLHQVLFDLRLRYSKKAAG